MAFVMKEFEHLKIPLEELKRATNSFGSKVIGAGGFGKVYQGEVLHSKGRSMVAIKRLNREFGQGDPEFWKEIMMLSRYSHKNLISLLGFCDEDGEKILVYEHASNGSLDRHLSSAILTWTQRLKICIDVAMGLAYLHDHKGSQQRVLHRDIKSANILLDDNWNAKLSDMGLSKIGPANQQYTVLFTNVVGTPGYCDPQYMCTYTLTKESDIYSFGVVLFEVLCGRLCFQHTNNHLEILVPLWKQSYEHKKIDQIMFKDLTPSLDPTSLETISDIAFQCLHYHREQRPSMSLLVKKLKIALEFQNRHEKKLRNDVGTSQKYRFVDELSIFLSKGKGIFINRGKTKIGAKRKDAEESSGSMELVHFDNSKVFTADDLWKATAEKTRKSTYGTNYKATLENGDQVAILRLGESLTKGHREFEVELNLLGNIRHPNLLAPRAYFLAPTGETILVYDYMPKGSVDAFLRVREFRARVGWPTRMLIIKGVARGLLSLHTHYNIIHGNLTSHNVLLDENINPKISDFGLSLMMAAANSHTTTTALELKKADVYSLGVIMLELLTGRLSGEDGLDLPQAVAVIQREDSSAEVFDDALLKHASADDEDELINCLHLAMDCVHSSPWCRPDVQLLLQILEEIRPETTTSSGGDGGAGSSLS